MSLVSKIQKLPHLFKRPLYSYRNKRTDYFQWRDLLKYNFIPVSPFILPENLSYGHIQAFRNMGRKIYGSRIEHGVYLNKYPEDLDNVLFTKRQIWFYRLRRIYTYSEIRAEFLRSYLKERNLKVDVIPVGPYILNADYFYPENKRQLIKKKYGKILLCFPQHSTKEVKASYSINELIQKIKALAVDFDSVFVSLHPHDLLHGGNEPYEKAGFTVVCSGFFNNPLFLSRQKDLISLADVVVSNAVGTNLGYAVAMNKPVYLIPQDFEYVATGNASDARNKDIKKHLEDVKQNSPSALFFQAFNTYPPKITPEQLALVHQYWGEF